MNFRLLHLFLLVFPALLTGLATPCAAQSSQHPPHHFASLQLLHPIATSPNPETTTNLRFSVLYGRSGEVRWVDLNLGIGVTSSGGTGFAMSGLANYNEDAFAGLQLAGSLNYVDRGFAGAQISGILNLNDGGGTFLQACSVANINAGPFAGLQWAGLLNAANSRIGGGQIALANYAENMNGFQIGVFNLARQFHGLQVGILNHSREFSGTPIGLINMDDHSRREWMFYGSNLSLANIGFRTVLNNWSSIVSAGYGDAKGDVESSLFLGWNFGRNIPLGEKLDLTIDLGFQHVIPQKSSDPVKNDRLHYSLQARAIGEYHLNENLGLVGSLGSSTVFDEYSSNADSETDLHFIAGIVLY